MATGVFINKPPSLPPYPEMILEAIEALNEDNGSNKSSISKYIESTYGGLPQGHKVLLNVHLAKMRDSGVLVFWKNNYTKRDPKAPPRRKPPKALTESGRPRGRPRKMTRPTGGLGEALPASKVKAATSGRPRGRPPKVKPVFTEISA
ncbi:HMG-Y-related protein A [Glycine soja]|nr:HMG-Y-related protein A [Glycine soja]